MVTSLGQTAPAGPIPRWAKTSLAGPSEAAESPSRFVPRLRRASARTVHGLEAHRERERFYVGNRSQLARKLYQLDNVGLGFEIGRVIHFDHRAPFVLGSIAGLLRQNISDGPFRTALGIGKERCL
jgi:hypothetical protein